MTDKNTASTRKAQTPPIRRTRLDRLIESLVDRVLAFPRMTRVILAGVFALFVILLVRPIIDVIYLDNFYVANPETNMLPTWVATVIGLIMYGAGWRLIVGVPGEPLTKRRAVFYYLFIGIGSLLIVMALIVYGWITVNIEV
ncbi:MAG: hypothetical protein SGI73_10105 [Chloroflexota bacterium]|nr:hypothetical protein [Chloroflexota bacterium]